jgi:dipeptidase E
MHLYLSSYKIGNRAEELSDLFKGNRRVGVIRNALDFSDDLERLETGRKQEFADLESMGLSPESIDLRDYFFDTDSLKTRLDELTGLWVVGGNTFILRKAFHQSGLEDYLKNRIPDQQFVYGGYSAGICVMTPTLEGIHLADEPDLTPAGYQAQPIWEGLGFVPYCIAPHYRSNHHETELIEKSVEYFIEHKIPFVALKDGEVLILELKHLPNNPNEKMPRF